MRCLKSPNSLSVLARPSWAYVFALTNCRIEIGDHRSERDDDQLDGLAPFRPLENVRAVRSQWPRRMSVR
jgi:hypothetical protein